MSEIEVEAVDEMADAVGTDAPEYVLYGGKGGVGKTTMAAATALASARDGVATLAVSTDPAHSLSDVLETPVPAEPARLREDVPLYGAEIDPEAADGEPLAGADLGGLGEMLGGDEGLSKAMPGADEAAAMELLLTYLDDDRFDRVVVDTAPTGHTLRLLELPEVMDTMVGRLVQLRKRLGGMMAGLGGLFGGADGGEDPAGTMDLQALRDRIERLRAVLADPRRTDFRVVMVPETMSVDESERLLDRLEGFGIPVGTVVVNRVMQAPSEVADADPDWFETPDLEECAFCRRRWEVQREALASAQDAFRGHDVERVPLFAREVRGEEMLAVVAACLD